MKPILLLIFIPFFLLFSLTIRSQEFRWARQIKGITYDYADYAEEMELDNNGNTYVFGKTESPLFDIDPTISGIQIIDNSQIQNFGGLYLIKLDKNGNYLWGKTFGNYKRGGDNTYGIKIGSDGNINLLATIADYNSSTNVMDTYISIIKINPNGETISTKKINQSYGYNNSLNISSFDIDNHNNIFLTGYLIGNIALDSTNPSMNVTSTGIDNYVLKINSDGNYEWIKTFTNTPGTIAYSKAIIGQDGNVNLLNGEVLYKLNSADKSIIWEKHFIDQTPNGFYILNNNMILTNSSIYITPTVDVDPSPAIANVSSSKYIVFLNLNGEFVDVKIFEKNSNINFTTMTTDSNNNYIIIGDFGGGVITDFDPSSNIFNLTPSYNQLSESFYLKLDANRNFVSAFKIGQEEPQLSPYNNCYMFHIKKIKTLNDSNYMIGNFMWTCDFDPSKTTQYTLGTINSSTINSDGFVLKLGPCDTSKPNEKSDQFFCDSNPTISNLLPNSIDIKWYNSVNSSTPLLKTLQLVEGNTYYATQQNENCPESTERLAVIAHINQTPSLPTITNANFCKKDNAKLSDIGVIEANLKWYNSNTSTIPLANSTLVQNTTTYYVSQTIGCESERLAVLVNVDDTPLPTANTLQSFCIQQNATLNDITITGQNLKWYDALTTGSLLLNTTPLQNGNTYYASQTINGCEGERIPVTVTIQNTLAPTGNVKQSFCTSQNPTLSTFSVVGSTIKWYDSATLGNLLTDTTPLVNSKTYYATQTVNNCESVGRLAITVSLISSLPANDHDFSICDDFNDGSEYVKLGDYNSYLTANATNYTFSYYKSLMDAENEVTSNKITTASNYKLSLGENTIYVRINSNTPCYAIAVLKITLVPKPIIPIQDIVPICENKSILIDAGSGADSYLWSNGKTAQTITVDDLGDLSVTVTKNYGTISCSSTKSFTVKTSNIAKINAIETKDWTDNDNTITVFVTGSGDFEYSIDGRNYQDSNTFSGVHSGEYIVQVRDKNGCGTATQEVYLLMYPKFFTPNGDSFNDTWKIKSSDTENELTIKIFDRFGKLLKELDSKSIGWDGTYIDQTLPATDYWFVVTRKNGKEYKGHFSLKR